MDFWSSFGSTFWWLLSIFAFVAYLMVVFSIVQDLIRDDRLAGWAKALWFVFLLFVPFLTALVYVFARGRGMAERTQRAQQKVRDDTERYIREVAGSGPSDEIGKAKSLLDSGAITEAEFGRIKAHALRGATPTPVGA
jgi:hypothetical protein